MNDGFPSIVPKSYAPITKSGNFTAALDREYIVTANATVTDPTGAQGQGFTVYVRAGTVTVGGVAYGLAGTTIRRVYHSGAWASKVLGVITQYALGGTYVGDTPSDPGANNLAIQGALSLGGTLTSGVGVSTGDVSVELGGARTGDGNCYMDFHSKSGTDYEARILRAGGTNGAFQIINTGTGDLQIAQAGLGAISLSINAVERVRLTSTETTFTGDTVSGIYRAQITTDSTAGIINALSSANGIARLTGAAPDLRGITAKAGAFVTVWFQNASTIRHAAGTAAAADRITTNTAADIAIAAGSSVQFFYDSTSAVWRPIRG